MKILSLLAFILTAQLIHAQIPVTQKLDQGTKAFEKAQFEIAKKYYQQAYALIQSQTKKDSLGYHTELQLGKLYFSLSQLDSARLWFNKALFNAQSIHGQNHTRVSRVYAHLAKVENKAYDIETSKTYLEEMLKIHLRLYAPDHLAQEENSEDLSPIDTFLKLADETNLLEKIPELYSGIGDALVNHLLQLNRLDDAEELLLKILNIYRSKNASKLEAIAYTNLGQISAMRYQYTQAQQRQLKALSYFKKSTKTEDRIWLANIWHKIGRNYSGLYQSDSALVYKNKALMVYEDMFSIPNQAIADMYSTMAYDHLILGNNQKSLQFLDKALVSGIADKLTLLYTKGLYLESQQMWEEAALSYKSALSFAKGKYHSNKANVLTNLAILLNYDLSLSDSAQITIDKAIAINMGMDQVPSLEKFHDFESCPTPVNLLNTLVMKANLLSNEPDGAADMPLLLQSIKVLDLAERLIAYLRLQFILEEDNIVFSDIISGGMEAFVETYTMAYDKTKNQEYLLRAFEYSDMNKSQSLLEALKSSSLSASNSNSPLGQWAGIKKKIKNQKSTLTNLRLTASTSTDQLSTIQKELKQSENELRKLLKKITRENTNLVYYISDEIRKSKAEKLQEYLRESNSIVIQYYVSSLGVYQYLITEDAISYKSHYFGDTIKTAVNQIVDYIDKNTTIDKEANQEFLDNSYLVYQKLFQVLDKGEFADKNLIVIPENYLSKLPFEVLLTDAVTTLNGEVDFKTLPYLIKERNISYAFSASVFIENSLSASNRASLKSPTAWAPYSENSDLDEVQAEVFRSNKLSKLTGASKEIVPLVDKFKGQAFMNKVATESNFKEHAQESKILHIATHGIVDHGKPEMSYLAFANEEDKSNDGYLHLFEVYDIPINNDLTILSACHSGDGNNFKGEGVMSMARAFTYAGSKSVLMSLWLANDNSTSTIIEEFYDQLGQEKTKGVALRNSKLAYLESSNNLSAHPFYWSHLILSGDNSPITPAKDNKRLIMFILMGVVVLVIISRIIRKRHSA